MSDTVIKVENISKQYRLGNVGLGSLSHDINRWYHTTIRSREDPYLKIGDANDRSVKGESDYIWALRDINFEVKKGEVLGIIGRNGAGKSTLLKILSRTTTPTTGQIKIKGRVASLLEVGTGFHPELTGRENIFLNGAILGMTKKEIKLKFDEIVDFAGVERYVDTPVKRYSSGMYVRLAFAVAAHLEPEILIVDEVLAVGDSEFQKKALGKMKEVSEGQGRTVLFVSHNMTAMQKLCSRGILLINGGIARESKIDDVIDEYTIDNRSNIYSQEWENETAPGNEAIQLLKVNIDFDGGILRTNTKFTLQIKIYAYVSMLFNFSVVLKNSQDEVVFNCISEKKEIDKNNIFIGQLEVPGNLLNDGQYKFDIYFVDSKLIKSIFSITDVLIFEVKDERDKEIDWIGKWSGVIRPKLNFKIND